MNYKGIDLNKAPHIKNYISTFVLESRYFDEKEYLASLDADKPLQKYVKNYYIKQKLYITTFNLSIYVLLYSLTQLIG